jgi:NADH-quinone oxidoreductase subunit E
MMVPFHKSLARDRGPGLACRRLGVASTAPKRPASARHKLPDAARATAPHERWDARRKPAPAAPNPKHAMTFALTEERERTLQEILSRYPTRMAACIPMLHLCQEQHGWVSDEICEYVAKRLDLSAAHVKGVATFYSLFNKEPVGKHQVWVCRTLPCALAGADSVLHHCEKRLGIHAGETTKDGKVTLRTAECLASCGTGPMMQVDRDYHENLTLAEVDKILDGLTR